MKSVFVDNSALIALGNKQDTFYRQAQKIRRELIKTQRKFVTTSFVIVELCSAFSGVKLRSTAIDTVESIYKSDKWMYLDVDRKLMTKGFEHFKQMADKEWTLVDCVSMIVAKEFGIIEIFTNDHHFEQAGFQILLKD